MTTAVIDQSANRTAPTASGKRWAKRLRIAGMMAGAVLIVLVAFGWWRMTYVPTGLDYSTTRLTDNGLYQVSYEPSQQPIPINKLHSWVITLSTADGRPLEHAHISIDGDMPQHGHGLPTQPLVTEYLGEGQYLVEGVKFQMGGWWVMDFVVEGDAGADKVRFNFILD